MLHVFMESIDIIQLFDEEKREKKKYQRLSVGFSFFYLYKYIDWKFD